MIFKMKAGSAPAPVLTDRTTLLTKLKKVTSRMATHITGELGSIRSIFIKMLTFDNREASWG
jgi:hypothetical protein